MDQNAVDQYLASLQQKGAAQASPDANAPPMDPDAYLASKQSTMQKVLHSAPVQYGLRGLDYLGGLTRTAAAAPFSYKDSPEDKSVVSMEDLRDAFKGQAPTTAQYMDKMGVPQGKSLSDLAPGMYSEQGSGGLSDMHLPEKHGPLDPTARGVVGFAGDVALDPLTYATAGIGSAAKKAAQAGRELSTAEKVAQLAGRPTGTALDALGAKVYGSGLKNIDKVITSSKVGKEAISPELMAKGIWGKPQVMADANEALRSEAGATIGDVAKQASDKGAKVDMLPATNQAWEIVNKMKQSPRPEVQAAADDAAELIQSYVKKGQVPVDQALKYASEANKFASRKAFAPLTAADATYGQQLDRALGQGIAKESSSAIKSAAPELHDQFLKANQVYGSSRAARKPFETEISKYATKNPVSQIDMLMLGGGVGSAALHNPTSTGAILGAFGAKQAAKGMNSMAGRTGTGLLLREAAKPSDELLRQSAWKNLMDQQNQQEK